LQDPLLPPLFVSSLPAAQLKSDAAAPSAKYLTAHIHFVICGLLCVDKESVSELQNSEARPSPAVGKCRRNPLERAN
jgi:hypothetical protein